MKTSFALSEFRGGNKMLIGDAGLCCDENFYEKILLKF